MRGPRLVAPVALALAGCTIGDAYVKPDARLPAAHRDAPKPAKAGKGPPPVPLGERTWETVFPDPALQELLRAALEANFDLRTAAERVEVVRHAYRIQDSFRYPSIAGGGSLDAAHLSDTLNPGVRDDSIHSGRAALQASWEIDLWGRLRNLSEAAWQDYLAAEWFRRGVETAVVGDVAEGWFRLLDLDLELEISERTLRTYEASLRLTQLRLENGVSSALEVRQSEQLLATAARNLPDLRNQIAQTENALRFLTGADPGPVRRGRPLTAQVLLADIDPGAPALLLVRRPDIQAAEAALIGANARVSAARALYFPQITLAGLVGLESDGLSDFLESDAVFAEGALAAVFPIFTAGRTDATVEAERANQRALLASYDGSVRAALRDVASALSDTVRTREIRAEQERLFTATAETARLANLRFIGGVDSYLQVLDAERQKFDAELGLAQTRRDEHLAVVRLYRALGGGWTDPAAPDEAAKGSADVAQAAPPGKGAPRGANAPQAPADAPEDPARDAPPAKKE